LVLSAPAFATHDDISLGEPGYGGTGCPDGTVSVTLSPDQKSLSLLFDQYQVEVGGDTGKSFDRKSCNIAIPVHVPQGLSVLDPEDRLSRLQSSADFGDLGVQCRVLLRRHQRSRVPENIQGSP
jgi:hypothetical protein